MCSDLSSPSHRVHGETRYGLIEKEMSHSLLNPRTFFSEKTKHDWGESGQIAKGSSLLTILALEGRRGGGGGGKKEGKKTSISVGDYDDTHTSLDARLMLGHQQTNTTAQSIVMKSTLS